MVVQYSKCGWWSKNFQIIKTTPNGYYMPTHISDSKEEAFYSELTTLIAGYEM